jgi:hypothetical protein
VAHSLVWPARLSTTLSESRSDAANHEMNSSDDDWEEKSEKGEEGIETCGKLTRKPWPESDELILLSLKDEQGMEWKEIYKRFLDRTHGAVQVRYYMLHKKASKDIVQQVE